MNRKQKCYSNCIELHIVVQNFIKVGDSIADEEKNSNHCGSGCIDDFVFILMSKKIMNSVWYKTQWNINFPFVEAYYTVDDMWESYNIYLCSENDKKVLKTSLYKQIPTKYWEEEMIGHLENMNIDPVMYPSFSEINYCIRRQKGDAELIMLMSSSQDMLYVYTCTR